jgi:TonB C terminal
MPMNLLKSPAISSILLAAVLSGCATQQQQATASAPGLASHAQASLSRPQARISEAWNRRLTATIAPNIEYSVSQPRPAQTAEFTVFMSPDGLITDKALLNSSGNPLWDRAASLALRKTSRLPVDDSGVAPHQALIAIGATRVSAVVIQHMPAPSPPLGGASPAIGAGGYAGLVAATLRPNIVFYGDPDEIPGNPAAEFDVLLAPDGTIISATLAKSSGWPDWDAAARRGILKTERLPRDVDGKVPARLTLALRPKR